MLGPRPKLKDVPVRPTTDASAIIPRSVGKREKPVAVKKNQMVKYGDDAKQLALVRKNMDNRKDKLKGVSNAVGLYVHPAAGGALEYVRHTAQPAEEVDLLYQGQDFFSRAKRGIIDLSGMKSTAGLAKGMEIQLHDVQERERIKDEVRLSYENWDKERGAMAGKRQKMLTPFERDLPLLPHSEAIVPYSEVLD